jgi:magnesium-protoporphyrin IX monomethyl ester (oxidative) cyclase
MTAIKKCLLFVPPVISQKFPIDVNPLPPLGLGYIAAVMEKMGLEIKIVDCLMEGWHYRKNIGLNRIRIGLEEGEIKKIIEDFSPDLVGVNNLFSRQYKEAHSIYQLAKEVDNNIITVAGGPHPTVMAEFTLRDPKVDYVVLGEGEIVIEKLIAGLNKGDIEKIRGIDGLGYKEDGEIIVNPKTTFIEDLDKLPFPARHLLNMEKYFGLEASHGKRRHKRFSPIVTSRGCAAKCTFCTAYKVWGRKYRMRSPENVIEEMKELKNEYGIEELLIEDDNITLNPKRAERLFDLMIKEKLDLQWDTPNGVAAYTLNKDLIRKMKEAGCYKINLAVESGNQQTLLNVIKKPLMLTKVKEIVDWCREIDLEVGMFLVFGMPGDTLRGMWDSIKFAKKIKIYYPFISIATPYPGSEIYKICEEEGYFAKEYSLENLYIRNPTIRTENFRPYQVMLLLFVGKWYLRFSKIIDSLLKSKTRKDS